MAPSQWQVRPKPCSHCGEKVVIVETSISGLGGLLRLKPAVRVQHADFAPGDGKVDHVDDDCRREPATDVDRTK